MTAQPEDGAVSHGALSGVKVLDLTRVTSGPFATMILGDLGADVIKVEAPGRGDDVRSMDVNAGGRESGPFIGANRNKRSITLDLKSEDDRPTLERLMRWADVVVENFRSGVAERLKVDYETVRALNPTVVYCAVGGFGHTGRRQSQPAYDIIGQALSGIMDITGEPRGGPAKCGAPVADITCGVYAALGIVTALYHRSVTGEGQRVETSLVGATLSQLSTYVPAAALGTHFSRVGGAHSVLAPYQAFVAGDGSHFILAVGNDRAWRAAMDVVEMRELTDDPRFATNDQRIAHRDLLARLLTDRFGARDAAEWVRLFEDAGVPASPIHTLADVAGDEDFRSNGYIDTMHHPTAGDVPVVMTPLRFSRTPSVPMRAAPLLDENREEVLDVLANQYDSLTETR